MFKLKGEYWKGTEKEIGWEKEQGDSKALTAEQQPSMKSSAKALERNLLAMASSRGIYHWFCPRVTKYCVLQMILLRRQQHVGSRATEGESSEHWQSFSLA